MEQPLFTIAIPTYNSEKIIRGALESCIEQVTDVSYEILISDNASTDTTPAIIASYDNENIRIITHKEQVSIWENHNLCLNEARGKYIIFCHSDDKLENNAIEAFSDKLKERGYPDKYVVWGHSMFRDYYLQLKKAGFNTNELIVGEYASLLPMNGGLTPSGTCYSKESFLELGGFVNTDILIAPSDITTMFHLALHKFRFEMMDKMVFIREDASTTVKDTNIDYFLEAYDDAYKHFIEVTEEYNIYNLIQVSTYLDEKPYYFYYPLAQDKRFQKDIKRILIKEFISNPLMVKSKIVRKVIGRVFL